ncbi:MAG: DUF6062 family protein [Defluviitaleaceae bacterium]|nr:DUF6062 family protein [Defluviitaleaceae bacterium]
MDHIHTIPVLDALREPGCCAFCAMADKLEGDAIHFVMGPSYMEDDIRMETNKMGFCKRHLEAMYKHQNRLGLALMLHTHVRQVNDDMYKILKGRVPAPFFGRDPNSASTKLKNHLVATMDSCYVCRKVDSTFQRYFDTFMYLWGKGKDEARLIESQKGYCMPHFVQLLATVDKLGKGKRERFLDHLLPMWYEFSREMEEDLDWFIQKFEHKNAGEPWKNSKDALPRALNLLGGIRE